MIKQLRRKFIIVAMGSLLAVLLIIVGSLNLANYWNMVSRADKILVMLSENEGQFPEDFPGREFGRDGFRPDENFDGGRPAERPRDFFEKPGKFHGLSVETPYDTRFFSVKLDETNQPLFVDTGRVVAVEKEDAVALAVEVSNRGRNSGFTRDYRYICSKDTEAGKHIVFVDCSKELASFRMVFGVSTAASLAGVMAVFMLVLIFSKKVFAPVEESYRKQKQFITDASHELKTPLTVISANVDIIEMEAEETQWTASIRNQVERLRNLTEQMVALSRLEETETAILGEVNLSQLVSDSLMIFEPVAVAQGKHLIQEIEAEILCKGEEEKLRQLLSLLLDNALKYTEAHGEIQVKLQRLSKGGKTRLQVSNTVGPDSGIKKGNQDMLFERFYRTDTSRNSKTGGSGIGLSIAKAIAVQHGGKLSAYSEDGKSISFIFDL